jgi:diaminopimelate decarboxylase
VFSGVGKTAAEMQYALEQGIYAFNCESAAELLELSKIATQLGCTASVAFRVNPDVDAATHPYISTGLREHKFGIGLAEVESLYQTAATLPGIAPQGVSCHIGSQLLDYGPILDALEKVLALVTALRRSGIPIRHLDIGGGIGARYRYTDHAPCIAKFAEALASKLNNSGLELLLEPGRSIVAEAGILLTRVLLTKQNGAKTFVVTDAAMNDLVRPALYQAYHEIVPVSEPGDPETVLVDVVGPVCETGDFFAHQRAITRTAAGDLLAIQTAGAYGFSLSSNYNSRPRAVEILVDGAHAHLIRRRETIADLIRGESLPQSSSPFGAQ